MAIDSTGVKHHIIPSFKFKSGKTVKDIKVAYREFNKGATTGTVLIPTCFGGRVNTTLTFTKDTSEHASSLSKYHVVVAAMLGNGESSSPSNEEDFVDVDDLRYEDVINAHYDLLTKGLDVKSLEAVIGFSMGGQQAYHWAVMYPTFMKRSVSICSSARTSGHNYAFLEGPIISLVNGGDYQEWKRGGSSPAKSIKAFSRAYAAWLTSAAWFREGHWKSGGKNVDEWITSGERDDADWSADDLLVLARMWQKSDVGVTAKGEISQLGGDIGKDQELKSALGAIKAKMLIMPCRTDQYFTPEASEIEIDYMKAGGVDCKLAVIESVWGHIAGGSANPDDVKFMDTQIAECMAS